MSMEKAGLNELKFQELLAEASEQKDDTANYLQLTGASPEQIKSIMQKINENKHCMMLRISLQDFTHEKIKIIAEALKENKNIFSLNLTLDASKNFTSMKDIVKLLQTNNNIEEIHFNNILFDRTAAAQLNSFLSNPACSIKLLNFRDCEAEKGEENEVEFKIAQGIRLNKSIINLLITHGYDAESNYICLKENFLLGLLDNHNIQHIYSNEYNSLSTQKRFYPTLICSSPAMNMALKEHVILLPDLFKEKLDLQKKLNDVIRTDNIAALDENCKKTMLAVEILGSKRVFDLFYNCFELFSGDPYQNRRQALKAELFSGDPYQNRRQALKAFEDKLENLYKKTSHEEREILRNQVKKEMDYALPMTKNAESFTKLLKDDANLELSHFSLIPKELIQSVNTVLKKQEPMDLLTTETFLRRLLNFTPIILPNPNEVNEYKKSIKAEKKEQEHQREMQNKLIQHLKETGMLLEVTNNNNNNANPQLKFVLSEESFVKLSAIKGIEKLIKEAKLSTDNYCDNLHDLRALNILLNFLTVTPQPIDQKAVRKKFQEVEKDIAKDKKIDAQKQEQQKREQKQQKQEQQKQEHQRGMQNKLIQYLKETGMLLEVTNNNNNNANPQLKFVLSEESFVKLSAIKGIEKLIKEAKLFTLRYCDNLYDKGKVDELLNFLSTLPQPIDQKAVRKKFQEVEKDIAEKKTIDAKDQKTKRAAEELAQKEREAQEEKNLKSQKLLQNLVDLIKILEKSTNNNSITYYTLNLTEEAFVKLCQIENIIDLVRNNNINYGSKITKVADADQLQKVLEYLKSSQNPIELSEARKWFQANITVTPQLISNTAVKGTKQEQSSVTVSPSHSSVGVKEEKLETTMFYQDGKLEIINAKPVNIDHVFYYMLKKKGRKHDISEISLINCDIDREILHSLCKYSLTKLSFKDCDISNSPYAMIYKNMKKVTSIEITNCKVESNKILMHNLRGLKDKLGSEITILYENIYEKQSQPTKTEASKMDVAESTSKPQTNNVVIPPFLTIKETEAVFSNVDLTKETIKQSQPTKKTETSKMDVAESTSKPQTNNVVIPPFLTIKETEAVFSNVDLTKETIAPELLKDCTHIKFDNCTLDYTVCEKLFSNLPQVTHIGFENSKIANSYIYMTPENMKNVTKIEFKDCVVQDRETFKDFTDELNGKVEITDINKTTSKSSSVKSNAQLKEALENSLQMCGILDDGELSFDKDNIAELKNDKDAQKLFSEFKSIDHFKEVLQKLTTDEKQADAFIEQVKDMVGPSKKVSNASAHNNNNSMEKK